MPDRALFDMLLRRRTIADQGVELDLLVARELVDQAARCTDPVRLRAALLDEAVACLSVAQRLPRPRRLGR